MKQLFIFLVNLKSAFCYALLLSKADALTDLIEWGEIIPLNSKKCNRFQLFCLYFRRLPEFRSVVYWRTGGIISHVLAFMSPKHSSLYLDTPSNKVGAGLVIQHGHSTIIHAEKIGEKCQIWQNVTIGKKVSGGKKPIIGNNVKVYAGAVVLGDITIGDNAQIGANSVVIKNVPPNCVVVGNPAHIIRRNGVRVNEML